MPHIDRAIAAKEAHFSRKLAVVRTYFSALWSQASLLRKTVPYELPQGCRELPLDIRGDERGSLISLESATGVPFQIRRVYYIFGTEEGVTRGHHAHRKLSQWAICVSGGCTLTLDDGQHRSAIRLDSPDRAIEIGSMVWREISEFTPDAVLLVLASEPYDESDYIRDYATFLELARA